MIYDAFGIDLNAPVDPDHDLNRGLVAWYLALPQTAGGATLYDLTGRAPGTLNAGATWASSARPGSLGPCLRGDGSTGKVDLGAVDALDITGDLTLSAWVRLTGSGLYVLIGAYTGGAGYALAVGVNSPGKVDYYNSGRWFGADTAVDDGEWHHVAVVSGGDEVRFYRDGLPDGLFAALAPAPYAGSRALLANPPGSAFWWPGDADDIAIRSRALSADEVRGLYLQSPRSYPDTLRRLSGARAFLTAGAGAISGGTLVATGHGSASATFTWSGVGGGTAPRTVRLQRSPSGAGTWTDVAGATATPATATGLARSAAYDFRVLVTDATAATAASNTVAVTTAAAADYTSAATGAWATPATWTPAGPPASGDTATIASGHTVTVVDGTTAIAGASGAAGAAAVTIQGTGKLIVGTATGATLVARGDILLDQGTGARTPGYYPLTLNPGSVLEFDSHLAASPSTTSYECGPTYHFGYNAIPRLDGNSAHRVTVRSNAGGANGRFSTRDWAFSTGQMSASYADFLRIGAATRPAIEIYCTDNNDTFAIDHCTFDPACGQVGGTAGIAAGATIAVVDNLFANTANATCLRLRGDGATPTGTRTVSLNAFDCDAQFDNPQGFGFSGNRFADGYTFTGSAGWGSFAGNQVGRKGAGLAASVVAFGDTAGNHFSWGYDGVGNNPHILDANILAGSKAIDGNIFEVHISDQQGDLIVGSHAPASAETITVTRNIVLPDSSGEGPGELVSLLNGNANLSFVVDHNTVTSTNAVDGTAEQGLAVWGENYAGRAGIYASIRGNLAYTPAGKAPGAIVLRHNTSTVGDAVAAADADYNAANSPATIPGAAARAIFGTHGGYLDSSSGTPTTPAWTGSPGAHDLIADPALVDPARNLATWYTASSASGGFGGTTAGTYLGDVAAASAAIRLDRSQIARLIAWVKAGWRPTNPAYAAYSDATHAFPGDTLTADAAGTALAGTIGAMAYLAGQTDPVLPASTSRAAIGSGFGPAIGRGFSL